MKILKLLLESLILNNCLFRFLPHSTEPVARKAPPYPGLTGVYQPNKKLANTTLIPLPSPGPESIVRHHQGFFFTGLANGDILDLTQEKNKI